MATPSTETPAQRRRKLARDLVMIALAVVSVLLLAALEYDWWPGHDTTLLYVDLGIVAIFWVEYAWRLRARPDKRAFVKANWYELPGMVPVFPGMEAVAGVRVLRLLRLGRILRLAGLVRGSSGLHQFLRRYMRESHMAVLATLAALVIGTCAGLVYLFETEVGTFNNLGDALWWALVTATTVGYGDIAPTTGAGRMVAAVLMLLGVTLVATVAATLSSTLVQRNMQDDAAAGQEADLAGRLDRLARLHDEGKLTDGEFERAKARVLE